MHKRRTTARWAVIAAATLAIPAALFALLKTFPSLDVTAGSGTGHFYIVSMVAALALVLAICVVWAARRLPDARTLFLAMGFVSMATIFLAHGLGTSPFFEHPDHSYSGESYGVADYGVAHIGHAAEAGAGGDEQYDTPSGGSRIDRLKVVGYSAQLSLFVSAAFFALATLGLPARPNHFVVRYWGWLVGALTLPLAGHVYVALFRPSILSWIPMGDDAVRYPIAATAVACLAFAGWRFLESYRLALLPLQGAMALGMGLLIQAQVFMTWGEVWHASWWEYHFVMLAGFIVCVGSLLVQYRLTGDLGAIVEGLFLRQQMNGIRAGDPRALVALGAAVAAKDTETSAHIERVGELAVDVGRHMGLPDDRLEVLRWAGRLHDVGKIGVPNSILRKPGKLTDREFDVMKVHSPRGGNIALKSQTLIDASTIIRAHHERMDGRGYPDGLAGDAIPIEARIVAVADVWDALTSDRPYRKAMPRPAAASVLRGEAGPHLDPACVEALFAVLAIDEAWGDAA